MSYNFILGKNLEGEEIVLSLKFSPEETRARIEREMDLRAGLKATLMELSSTLNPSRRGILEDKYKVLLQECLDAGLVVLDRTSSGGDSGLSFI